MKHQGLCALSVLIVAVVLTSDFGSASAGSEPAVPGDASCDGVANAIDAALILQHGAGLFAALACEDNADVNGDGQASAIDAALILQFNAGLLESLGPSPSGAELLLDKFGEGTVTSSPTGISCGSGCTVQSAAFPSGAVLVLTASPQPGSVLDHWSACDSVVGNTCELTMREDRTVFVTFRFMETMIPSTTKVLDESDMEHLLRQEGDTYYFGTDSEAALDFEPGDVMVSGVGEGLLRKVNSVNVAGGEIAVSTEMASLEEVIEKGTIVIHQELVPIVGSQASGAVGEPGGIFDQIDVGFDGGLGLSGSYSFHPYLDLAISFDGFELSCLCYPVRQLRSVLHMDQDAELNLFAEGGVSVSGERTIWQQPLAPILVPVGPIVLVFVPELSVDVGVSVTASAGFEVGVSLATDFSAGVEYSRDSGWRGIGNLVREASFSAPHVTNSVEAKVYVSPDFILKLAGVAGPFVSIEGFGRLRAEPTDDPWWTLSAGLRASAGFAADIPVFGRIAEFNAVVLEAEWVLAQADAGNVNEVITFVRDGDVWVMSADGSHQRLVAIEENARSPRWSPDGTQIAYAVSYFDSETVGTAVNIVSLDGTSSSTVFEFKRDNRFNAPTSVTRVDWLPDGRLLASLIITRAGGVGSGMVCIINPQSPQHIFDGNCQDTFVPFDFDVSPDGLIVGTEWEPDPERFTIATRNERIVLQQSLESLPVTVVDTPGDPIVYPSLSADGEQIAFVYDGGLRTVSAGGGESRLVFTLAQPGVGSAWSPDGGTLLAVNGHDSAAEILAVSPEGGSPVTLAVGEDPDWRP